MLDFMSVSTKNPSKGTLEVAPRFLIKGPSTDLMIRGGDFYAIWDEDSHLWSTDEGTALRLIDREIDNYVASHKEALGEHAKVLHMWDADSGMIDKWHKYVQKQLRDNYHSLDEELIFSNTETTKENYASKKLSYPLEQMETPAYDELLDVLYSPEERHKIEWAIGSVIAGESKNLQKFFVMYGAPKTGKSTVLNIIQDLFSGYYGVFDAKVLGSSNNSFALEAFKSNPLVGIQHDGDLSRIEDNTRLNSLVSHEMMTVNEKFKSAYATRFNTLLFMGTNKPVKITDSKSGILRRLIDITPTGNKIPRNRYDLLVSKVKFELGGIAFKCKEIYLSSPNYYDDYIPLTMLGASNDFFNFVEHYFDIFKEQDGVSMNQAWRMYNEYNEEAKVMYPYPQRIFKEELKSYFREFKDRVTKDGVRVWNYYQGFIFEKFDNHLGEREETPEHMLELNCTESLFDTFCADCPAQYGTSFETPSKKWSDVTTTLKDISTNKLHYVQIPTNHIVIDFDIKDENGNKCFELNAREAAKWPPTYAELSKGGQGIHLHYIYTGDPLKLAAEYAEDIEIKVYTGNSSLRRKLSKCNDIPIATISSGLPLKKESKVVSFEGFKNEKAIRTAIIKNLRKEYHSGTKPSVDFIYKILNDAYNSDLKYDVSDMYDDILDFAMSSTNHANYCMELVGKMPFKSEERSENNENYSENKSDIIFFDVEVFSNLFVVVWKLEGADSTPVKMINPSADDICELLTHKLVGFNCRRYDNHILYARSMGYTNEMLYERSKMIINKAPEAFFGEAYNLSYSDIYDFSSEKKSLKKFEIELGIHHKECEFKWDQPVPKESWGLVADYCVNDVLATEAVWNARKADFTARQILADLAGMTVNDTTNSLTTRIIFGKERKPNLVYTDLATGKQYT